MRRRSFLLISGAAFALGTRRANASQGLRVGYIAGAAAWPLYVAHDRGLFASHGLDVELVPCRGSGAVFKGLDEGDFQIGQASFDNAIAYDTGAGDVPVAHRDFIAFLGVDGGQLLFYGRPEIKSVADLRGKTIAVDARWTGFTFVVERILERAGVPTDAVTYVTVGGTPLRAKALLAGECAATLLTPPFTVQGEDAGLQLLANVRDVVGPYQGGAAFCRRTWVNANENAVVAYARASAEALAWLRTNRDAATAIFASALKIEAAIAARAAAQALGPAGLSQHGELDAAGMRAVAELRSAYVVPRQTVGDLAPYVDDRYLQRALVNAGKP